MKINLDLFLEGQRVYLSRGYDVALGCKFLKWQDRKLGKAIVAYRNELIACNQKDLFGNELDARLWSMQHSFNVWFTPIDIPIGEFICDVVSNISVVFKRSKNGRIYKELSLNFENYNVLSSCVLLSEFEAQNIVNNKSKQDCSMNHITSKLYGNGVKQPIQAVRIAFFKPKFKAIFTRSLN